MTAVLPVFCTVAVNCCVWELLRPTVAGETVTLTGSCQVTVRRVFVMDVHRSQQKSAWFAHGSGWLWVAVTGVWPELLRLTVAGETVTLTGSCQVTVRRVFVMDVHRSPGRIR